MIEPCQSAEPWSPDGGHDDAGDDAAVVARSMQDPDAFAVLFRRHAPDIMRYLTRRIGPHAAEDVLAETFLAAFRQRRGYDPIRADVRSWLYGIATNLVGRHRRTELRQLRLLARTGIDPVVEAFTERSDERMAADATRSPLASALASLGRDYRDALLLVVWGDLTYEEAASALGVPVGTVRSRVSRARSRLRAALGGGNPTAVQEERFYG